MIQNTLIVYDADVAVSTELKSLIEHIEIHYKVGVDLCDFKDKLHDIKTSTLVLLYLDDAKIKTFLKNHLGSDINIGFIANKESPRTLSSYGVSKDLYQALDEAMNERNMSQVDVLTCNGEIVLTNVVVGDVHGLNHRQIENETLFEKIKSFYINLKNLGFKDYTLTTAKEQVVQTVATGVMVLEHNSKSGRFVNDELSFHDGKLNAFIISPTSIFSYIYYLLVVTFYSNLNPNNLPKTLGLIKTSRLDVNSSKPMDFMLDGALMCAKSIVLEVVPNALNISVGANVLKETDNNAKQEEDKDTIKTQYLPKGEMKTLLLSESVPLFKKADEDDFKELFLALKESAKPSSIFVVLMLLSTVLATTGLFQSSAPVIIGAMILAPLMSPIISLSMGVVRGESFFITNSLKTLGIGIFTALLFSSVYTMFIPLDILTDEMRGRLNPNILDLVVAVVSGIAGAYANAKSEIAKSLAGVAIAVALVPPLSVAGIGLGWGEFSIFYGAFLLFLTNLVGITLAGAITFLVLGYAPVHRATKGIVYTSVILAVVTIPLVISFGKAIEQNNIIAKLNDYTYVENTKEIKIHILHVDLNKARAEIFLQTNSNDLLDKRDLTLLKSDIEAALQQKIILNVSTNTIIH